ncbi:hypothetical protein ACO0RG_001125 [Hanseniaspora osmophila]|uniref:Protein ASI2 n=1 Tax=Hanseniaspora osmophila TaxID=56408 RepID=A0A1E5RNM9_9ASCO|nr:Protein ASI2 [Hanseniaspora osmophila]
MVENNNRHITSNQHLLDNTPGLNEVNINDIRNSVHRDIPFMSNNQNRSIRSLLRWLFLLDRVLIAVLLPITLYNLTSVLMSEVTHTRFGLVPELRSYWASVKVLKRDALTNEVSLVYISNESLGLLSKFHNIIVYYTQNYITGLFLWTPFHFKIFSPSSLITAPTSLFSSLSSFSEFKEYLLTKLINAVLYCYPTYVKTATSITFLVYAVWTTLYLWFALTFFCICLGISLIRRYMHVVRMVAKLLFGGV